MALSTTTELRNFLAEEVGDSNPSSTEQIRLLKLLNSAHLEIVGGGGILNVDNKGRPSPRPVLFSWALEAEPLTVTTSDPITTGTLLVTQGSTAITFSSAPADSVAGWYLQVDGTSTVYRISAHTAASTSATLDSSYVDTTAAAATFVVFKLDYSFGDVSNLIFLPSEYIRGHKDVKSISMVPAAELRNKYPISERSMQEPTVAGIKSFTDGILEVQFNAYPEDPSRFELFYVATPAELTTGGVNPILPADDRKILVHLAAYYQLLYRDDAKSKEHLNIARFMFKAMQSKDSAFREQNDKRFGYIAPFPGGFSNTRRKGFSSSDYN